MVGDSVATGRQAWQPERRAENLHPLPQEQSREGKLEIGRDR